MPRGPDHLGLRHGWWISNGHSNRHGDALQHAPPMLPLCSQSGSASGRMCAPMTLLATICADMPTMAGCRSHVPLCANGSVVQQCADFPPLPGWGGGREGRGGSMNRGGRQG